MCLSFQLAHFVLNWNIFVCVPTVLVRSRYSPKMFRKEVIFRIKISGEEEQSNSKDYIIQEKVSLLWKPLTVSVIIILIVTKDICFPRLHFTYTTKIVYKGFIILETFIQIACDLTITLQKSHQKCIRIHSCSNPQTILGLNSLLCSNWFQLKLLTEVKYC